MSVFDRSLIESAYAKPSGWTQGELDEVQRVLDLLESGRVRAVNLFEGRWQADVSVKQAILVAFRSRPSQPQEFGFAFNDKFGVRSDFVQNGVRVVPGGSTVRRGAYLASGVIVMPPSYVNVGAFVDSGSMIDSHVLVGSCAHVGKNVHLSAGVMVGSVLEPPQARPVVIEDNVFVGGNCGIYEGMVIRQGAVIASGVVLNASVPVIDVQTGQEHFGEVPENAVVVPGGRKKVVGGREFFVSCPLIVKRRDAKTDARTCLEDALRV
jgi:2,3,4,5-tetrahydropyridine-2-carboxylate N-succinyltransferase